MCVNICELVVVMAKVKDLKIQSFKPPAFDGEAENFRHWKSEFRAYLILNGQEHLEYLTESTKELEQDSSRLRGYERIAKVLDPANLKDDQHRINREKLGALLLKALPDGDKRKLNTELDRFLNQTIDFCVLWHALCHMYSERSVVARQALMQELFRAEKRRGESRLDFGERLMGVWTELNNLPDKPMKMPEEQLVYIIVYGLKDATFQMAFFGRSEPEQSLERLMNDLRLVEDQDGDQGSSSGDILTSMAGYQQRGYQHQRQPERRCGRCGGNHEERKCTFTGTCYNCGRIGHMRRLCRTKNDGRQQHQKKKNRTVKFNTSGASVIGAEVRRGSVLEPLEMREMKNVWGIDSMANGHSTTDLALLHDVRRVKNPPTVHGMTGQIRLELEGTVRLEVKSVDGRKGTLTVHNVFYNPVGVCNNLSEAILEAEGIKRVTGGIKLREGFILPFHAASGEMKLKLVEAEPIRPKKDTTQKLARGGEPVRRNDEHVIVSHAAVSSKPWSSRRLNHSSVSLKNLQQKEKAFRNKIECEQKTVTVKRDARNALGEKLPERKPEKTEEEFVQKNYEYFDERIKELEDVIATTIMYFAEEKKALHEVQQRKTNEHVVEDDETALEEYNAVKQTVGDFRPQLKQVDEQIDQIKNGESSQSDELKKLDEEYKRINNIIKELMGQRDSLRKEINELNEQWKREKAELDGIWMEWKQKRVIERKRRRRRKVRGRSLASDMEAEATTVTESGGDWPEAPGQSAVESERGANAQSGAGEQLNLHKAGVVQSALDVKLHKDPVRRRLDEASIRGIGSRQKKLS